MELPNRPQQPVAAPSRRHRLVSFREVIHNPDPAPPPLIERLVPSGTVTLLLGPPKAGKTFLAVDLALALASGTDFLGFPVPEAKRVLMLSAEGGMSMLRKRLPVVARDAETKVLERCVAVSPVFLNLMAEQDLAELGTLVDEAEADVVVLDPLVRLHDAEENSSTQMAQLFGHFGELISTHDVSLIVVHHTGKDAYRGARGSSAITSSYDAAMTLSRNRTSDGTQSLAFDLRHYASPAPLHVAFDESSLRFSRIASAEGADAKPRPSGLIEDHLRETHEATKKELRDMLVACGLGESTAYKHIAKAEVDGVIVMRADERYALPSET